MRLDRSFPAFSNLRIGDEKESFNSTCAHCDSAKRFSGWASIRLDSCVFKRDNTLRLSCASECGYPCFAIDDRRAFLIGSSGI